MDKFLSKYTDEDDFSLDVIKPTHKNRKSEKSHKPEIKTKNKMFADVNFE
jgi:hypothetical protein